VQSVTTDNKAVTVSGSICWNNSKHQISEIISFYLLQQLHNYYIHRSTCRHADILTHLHTCTHTHTSKKNSNCWYTTDCRWNL